MVTVTRRTLKVGVEVIADLTKESPSNADDSSVVGLGIMDKRAELDGRDFVQRRRVDAQGILNIRNSTERIRILP